MGKRQRITIPDSPLIDVEVPSLLPHDVWVLSGNNGTGKTKLLEELTGKGPGRAFETPKGVTIAYLPQFWPEAVAEGTVEQFFEWVKASIDRFDGQVNTARFQDAVKAIGFRSIKSEATSRQPFMQRPLSSFSGGEQRLLWFLAVSCFHKVDALLLDEPTNHLDQQLQAVITKAIQDFPGAVVFSTHDLQLLDAIAEDVGKKGTTVAPKNIILTKKDGRTTITESSENPADHVRSRIASAKNSARKLRGKIA